jgi:hypothetical protein
MVVMVVIAPRFPLMVVLVVLVEKSAWWCSTVPSAQFADLPLVTCYSALITHP